MITLTDALRAQPELENEDGYQKWLANDDTDALNEALEKWGFGPMNEDGEIEE
jgi:hypothetical protein